MGLAAASVGFTDGPGIATEDTLLWGFGLEGVTTRAERAAVLKDAMTYLTRSRPATPPAAGPAAGDLRHEPVTGRVGGTVPATLSLTLGPRRRSSARSRRASARTYFATTTANVISTAGDALLSVADPSSFGTGHLVNGTFVLAAAAAGPGAQRRQHRHRVQQRGLLGSPLNLLTWSGPVSNDAVTLEFSQLVNANDPLRTGTYSKTLTFTLSTTQP